MAISYDGAIFETVKELVEYKREMCGIFSADISVSDQKRKYKKRETKQNDEPTTHKQVDESEPKIRFRKGGFTREQYELIRETCANPENLTRLGKIRTKAMNYLVRKIGKTPKQITSLISRCKLRDYKGKTSLKGVEKGREVIRNKQNKQPKAQPIQEDFVKQGVSVPGITDDSADRLKQAMKQISRDGSEISIKDAEVLLTRNDGQKWDRTTFYRFLVGLYTELPKICNEIGIKNKFFVRLDNDGAKLAYKN